MAGRDLGQTDWAVDGDRTVFRSGSRLTRSWVPSNSWRRASRSHSRISGKTWSPSLSPSRRELEALDTERLANVEQFLAIGKRLELLSATLTLLIGADEHEDVHRNA